MSGKDAKMKNLVIGLMATASTLVGLPSFAANPQPVQINGVTPAQCGISGATTATVNGGGPNGSIAGADGFLAAGLQGNLVAALAATNTTAWCSGLAVVNLRRTPLVRVGTNGSRDGSGFANAIGYDVAIRIANARRFDSISLNSGPHEGTADGILGPIMLPFGPTGSGNVVTFLNDSLTLTGFNNTPRVLNLQSSPNYNGVSLPLRFQEIATPTRLAAGDYSSTVTLTLSPVN
jgi:hypothetical protein